jgi:type IV pilus assembly protein PilM
MPLFGSSNESYVGVDIGTSSIKVVELKKRQNKVALVTYGFSDRLTGSYGDANKLDIKYVTKTLEDILRKANISSKNIIASLPTFTVFSSIINLGGNLSDKDLSLSINWEAKKVIPLPLEDIVLDWQRIDEDGLAKRESAGAAKAAAAAEKAAPGLPTTVTAQTPKKPTVNRILLIGAPKNLIKSYAYCFKSMKLNLVSLETEIFGLIRSLVGSDKAVLMIMQIGATSTNLFIVDKGVPLLSRTIDVGGLDITKAISKSLNISLAKAEQFKYDLSAGSGEAKLPKPIIDAVAPILNEAKYILGAFSNKENREIERVILTGGSSLLYNLPDHFAASLEKNVVVGDPWFRVAYPVELKPILEQIGPRLSVAIGLAMREFDKK